MYGYETHPKSKLPTVERFLFKALRRTGLVEKDKDIKEYDYSKCGRTDKGVSAAGNYFSIRLFINNKEWENLL